MMGRMGPGAGRANATGLQVVLPGNRPLSRDEPMSSLGKESVTKGLAAMLSRIKVAPRFDVIEPSLESSHSLR